MSGSKTNLSEIYSRKETEELIDLHGGGKLSDVAYDQVSNLAARYLGVSHDKHKTERM